jgi:hypothetical protein
VEFEGKPIPKKAVFIGKGGKELLSKKVYKSRYSKKITINPDVTKLDGLQKIIFKAK